MKFRQIAATGSVYLLVTSSILAADALPPPCVTPLIPTSIMSRQGTCTGAEAAGWPDKQMKIECEQNKIIYDRITAERDRCTAIMLDAAAKRQQQ